MGFDLVDNRTEFNQPTRQGAQELLFFGIDGFEDEIAAGQQFGIGVTHQIKDAIDYAREKGLIEADGAPLVDGAAQNPPEHIRAPSVAWQYAVGNQKGHCPAMVGHGVVGGVLGAVIFVITATQGFDTVNQINKHVGLVGGAHPLEHHRYALEPHAGIDRRAGQRLHGAPLKLHKHVVPDFDVIGVIAIHAGGRHFAEVIAEINGNFGAGTTGTGIGHYPEIVFFAKTEHAAGISAGFDPERHGVFVGGHPFVALEDGKPHALDGNLKDFSEQFPGHRNGIGLEIIAKRKIP